MDHFFNSTPLQNQGTFVNSPRPQPFSYPGALRTPFSFEEFEDNDPGKGLLDYWRILLRHKLVLGMALVVGLFLGLSAGIPMKSTFRAQTRLEILNLNQDFMNTKQADPLTTGQFSSEISEQETQAKLLGSNVLIDRVFSRLDPRDPLPWAKPHKVATGWRSWLQLSEAARLNPRQQLLSGAAASLKVRTTPKTRIIEITADSTDAQLAATFLNTLTQEYMQQSIEDRWSSIQKTSQWLGNEIDQARSKLQRSEDALQNYARQSGLIYTTDSTNLATEKLQQSQQSLSAATADRITKQSRYELAKKSQPDTLADVLGDPNLQVTTAKLNESRRELANLLTVYDPQFSKVRRVQAEADNLQRVVDLERGNILRRIENDYTEASRRESLLIAAYNSQIQEVVGQGEKEIQYNILKREVDSNRQLYDTMLQQMKQSSISSALRASTIHVVDKADVPDWPISPNNKLNMAIGMSAGLFLAAVTVIVRDGADPLIEQPGEINVWTGLPELGTIPTAGILNKSERMNSVGLGGGARSGLIWNTGAGSAQFPMVEALVRRTGSTVISEAFRSTLASILFGSGAARPKVLVFTSPQASEGKTTVVANLGVAVAEVNQKVLLIDADLRRPRMHAIFDAPNEEGLSTILRGESKPLKNPIQTTAIPGLHLLPAGPASEDVGHLFYSPRLKVLLDNLRQEYDMVLIDTPPMLHLADARLTARLGDAVVLIARAHKTTRHAIMTARERLAQDRTPVLGAIFNDWNPKTARSGIDQRYRAYSSQNHVPGRNMNYSDFTG